MRMRGKGPGSLRSHEEKFLNVTVTLISGQKKLVSWWQFCAVKLAKSANYASSTFFFKKLVIIMLISIGNSMICSDIWHKYHEWYFEIVIRNLRQFWNIMSGIYAKYHVQIMLLFVYTTTRKRSVIFTYFIEPLYKLLSKSTEGYRVYSLTWPASMQIYGNKGKFST